MRSLFSIYLVLAMFLLVFGAAPTTNATALPGQENPPYGLTVEKWKQIQRSPTYNQSGNTQGSVGRVFNNGGFEVANFTGWITQDLTAPFFPLQVGTAGVNPWFGFFVSDPPEGTFAALHGWDGNGPGTIRLTQDVTLPANALTLEFDYRAAWDLQTFGALLNRVFMVRIEPAGGGSSLQTDTVLVAVAGTLNNDTGNLHGSINVSAFANTSKRISFDWIVAEAFSGPAFFQLDNVFIKYAGPQIIVTENIAYGRLEVGTSSAPRTVTIKSVGTANCTVSGISNPGSPYILSNLPSLPVVIPPGSSQTFQVAFSPTSAGTFNSTVTVTSNDAVTPTTNVSLSGQGVVLNPALSGVCYASTGNSDGGRLLTINRTTGAGTLIGPTGLDQVPGLAINSNGFIYATSQDPDARLHRIDAVTGSAVLVANTGLAFCPAIAFDGYGVLYGLGVDPTTFEFTLYTINTSTGVPTIVGPAPLGDWRGMAFDPTDGTLWASTSGQEIYVINPNTGEPTLIGTTGLSGGTPDLHFDDMGNLYGAVGGGAGSNNFISINKTTGAGTIVGPIGFASVSGLAVRHQPLVGSHIGIIPGIVNFGILEPGTSSAPRTVTIRSVGSQNLTVSGISNPGSPYTLSNVPSLPAVLAPGSSATFQVTFSPTGAGTFNSTVTVTSNDPDDPTKNVSLTGKAIVINPAPTGVCYGSTGNNDGGRLLTINLSTGVGTLIGPTGLGQVPGLAINSNGFIYATSDDPDARLHKIDAVTGTAVFVGNAGLGWMPAIAFDGNDVLYGLGTDFTTGFNLYRINTTTGVPTFVSSTTLFDFRGMAFDPTNGTLWASTATEQIYIINPSTGASTLIGTTGLSSGTPDIDFDAAGNLYGAVGGGGAGSNNLVSINKTTGAGTVIGPIGFTSVSGLATRLTRVVGVNDNSDSPMPTSFALGQNYPNPFNPTTVIQYSLPTKALVTLKLYNLLGQEVATLVNKEHQAGSYHSQFDATNFSSGVYFYRLHVSPTDGGKTGEFVDTKKLVLLK